MKQEADKNHSYLFSQDTSFSIDSTIDPMIIQRAAEWMARLWSEQASEDDKARCQCWRAAHPDHERAWNRLQTIEDKLYTVCPKK